MHVFPDFAQVFQCLIKLKVILCGGVVGKEAVEVLVLRKHGESQLRPEYELRMHVVQPFFFKARLD
jgi:hypothetical protein